MHTSTMNYVSGIRTIFLCSDIVPRMSEAVNLHVQSTYRSKLCYYSEMNRSAEPSLVEVFADLLASAPRQ